MAFAGLTLANATSRNRHYYSPPPGHLLRLPVYTLGPFSHVRDPPFVSGTIHTVSHRSALSLSFLSTEQTDVCICVRKVLATFPFWKLILSNFVRTLRLILTSNVDIDICEDVLLLFSYWWLLNRLNRLFIFILIWRNWSVSLMI